MTGSSLASSMSVTPSRNRGGMALRALLLASVAAALQYAPPATAGGRHGGWFIGGLVVGAALAPRYAYPAPFYHHPRVYYAPPPVYYPPQVVYTAPPVYVQPPQVYVQPLAPIAAAPAAAPLALSIEDRLRRLRSLCDQGLFTVGECHQRREQILQEL